MFVEIALLSSPAPLSRMNGPAVNLRAASHRHAMCAPSPSLLLERAELVFEGTPTPVNVGPILQRHEPDILRWLEEL
jgi:hypothetical protein